MMEVVRTVAEMRERVAGWRHTGERISLVPTMGALHEGHMSLVRQGDELSDRSVVSIFVNPTQFAPHEDFTTYPRDESRDLAMLEKADVDLVFAPDVTQMYRDDHRTKVEVQGLSQILEGQFRPQFFIGVATVCAKLLIQTMPDVAIFGEKDYQQLCVIRAMARDLDLPVQIIGGDTIRESDGLAMSSRNTYLSNTERTLAPYLHQEITGVARRVKSGDAIEVACADATQQLDAAGFKSVDYVAVRDAETLEMPAQGRPMRVLAAAWLGKTRLIDNVAV
ncbi:MAG: pantoate--beta-alanine ligase [Rhodospirillales bacterium]|nr:pantoate--beta-alanine ligase [Rhodospirillales bacterium]MBO6787944.1 pantoate--beta-alanine ligase [Rhodospirillales bacterium]